MSNTDGRKTPMTPLIRKILAQNHVADIARPTRRQLTVASVEVTWGDNTTARVRCTEFARLWQGAGSARRLHDRDNPHAERFGNVVRGGPVAGTGKPVQA